MSGFLAATWHRVSEWMHWGHWWEREYRLDDGTVLHNVCLTCYFRWLNQR